MRYKRAINALGEISGVTQMLLATLKILREDSSIMEDEVKKIEEFNAFLWELDGRIMRGEKEEK